MNEILQFITMVLQKVKPVETKKMHKVKLKELDSLHLAAKGEIYFEAEMGTLKKDENYVLRYEIEKL